METKRDNHFLFVGRLSVEKGIEVLIDAFRDTSFELKIAGDGPLKQLVIDAAVDNKNICYLGSLKNEEVKLELQKAQAFIFPSIWYEGMPMTIIEAFSCSTPVIASNLGAMSSIISNNFNGFHFEERSPQKLKEAVKLFDNLMPEVKKHIQDNAYQTYKEKYSVSSQLSYFNTIYMPIINKRSDRND